MEGTENTQWIEDYLDGVLSEPDLKRFEEKLMSDPNFEKEVNAQRMVRESFERAELKEFFKQINESTKELAPAASKGPFSFGILAIAASIILAIGISLFFLFKEATNGVNQTEFVAQSFDLTVSTYSVRSIIEEVNVEIIESKQFKKHYSFNNGKLKLYLGDSSVPQSQIKIFYNPSVEFPFEIEIQGIRYSIEENSGAEPKPLTQIQK